MLPTVLVGIISIKFDQAARLSETVLKVKEDTEFVVQQARADLPTFFSPDRLEALRDLFDMMDANGELFLGQTELAAFYHYSFDLLFGVKLTPKQVYDLFLIMDTNKNFQIGFDEFVMAVGILKSIAIKNKADPDFAKEAFGAEFGEILSRKESNESGGSWNAAMARVDQENADIAWDAIVTSVNGEFVCVYVHLIGRTFVLASYFLLYYFAVLQVNKDDLKWTKSNLSFEFLTVMEVATWTPMRCKHGCSMTL